jgi:ABC-type thiamine transport system ATPase subunit
LDADTLWVTTTLGNEILLFAQAPDAVTAALAQWGKRFGLDLDMDRAVNSYSGGEQVLWAAGLWAAICRKRPPFTMDLRRAQAALSPENRARLRAVLAEVLPQATVLMEDTP